MRWSVRNRGPQPAPPVRRHRRALRPWPWHGRAPRPWPWRRRRPDHRAVTTPPDPGTPRRNRPAWADATVANPQVGRAGMLTPAQQWRANGGRW